MLYDTPKNPHHTIAKTKIKADVIESLKSQGFKFIEISSITNPFPCPRCHLYSLIKDYWANMYDSLEMDCTEVGCIRDQNSFIVMASHPEEIGTVPARHAIASTCMVYQVHE